MSAARERCHLHIVLGNEDVGEHNGECECRESDDNHVDDDSATLIERRRINGELSASVIDPRRCL